MKLKSYFVGTVEAAMELARQELGPEAMLVDSHKSPPEAKHLGDYEVVFASIPASQSRSDCAPNGVTASAQDGGALWSGFGARTSNAEDLFSREVADLRRQIEAMRRTIWRSGLNSAGGVQPFSAHAEVCSMLSEAEGAAIPLGARIVAVADTFDALTSDRAYHPSRPVGEVLRMLEDSCGYDFDPAVVPALIAWAGSVAERLGTTPDNLRPPDLLTVQEPSVPKTPATSSLVAGTVGFGFVSA